MSQVEFNAVLSYLNLILFFVIGPTPLGYGFALAAAMAILFALCAAWKRK